jgi:Helix-turn-helix of DDE superfamily endonuclease/DDE superfamily endonuclease
LLSYERLSRKPILFKSFTGLTLQEFDDIYDKEITKRYLNHELKRLSKRKNRERSIGAGRQFKIDVKNRILMVLVYYRLYITYTLSGFLFDLDQSNICRDIQKIEPLIKQCIPIPRKLYKITKRLRTPKEVEKYFPGFLSFIDSTKEQQQIPKPIDKKRKKKEYYSGKKKKHVVKTQLVVNKHGIILHKLGHKKGRKHDYNIYKKNHPVIPKEVVNVFDLGYLGIENDFPEQLSSHCLIKSREINKSYLQKRKKSTTRFIPKKRG